MNKAELIQELVKQGNITQKVAKIVVDTIFEEMKQALVNGERIEIRGFGSFSIREYEGYNGRNPKTGETVRVAPKRLPFFKVGKELRDRINQAK
ncbi:MAG: integration host factor subunit beta [Deltaproteobacteria bacterium]|nr:MAG: integration host factor subunit beta [Deltaproteobacteria bacterium]